MRFYVSLRRYQVLLLIRETPTWRSVFVLEGIPAEILACDTTFWKVYCIDNPGRFGGRPVYSLDYVVRVSLRRYGLILEIEY
jgi:hypothetical protein